MNDVTAPVQYETLDGKQVPIRSVPFNGRDVRLAKLGDIAEVKVGLQTGDNDAYLFQNPEARGTYRSIEDYRQFFLSDADLERIHSDENLRSLIVEQGISKDDPESPRFFGGRYIVPYNKGGESDSQDGWMPNYWVPTNYFIDWSERAVKNLLTGQRIRAISGQPYPRNIDTYFVEGITFSRTGVYAPTFRLNSVSPYDTEGCMLFWPSSFDLKITLAICASRLFKYQLKTFIGHTVHTQVDELKEAVFVIENLVRVSQLVRKIVEKQKTEPRYDYASNEQMDIDRLVYEAYGLNDADIREVEDWYVRRYPKLAAAQRRGLATKQGKTEEQLTERNRLHLFCDESSRLPHDRAPFLLLGLVACPAERVKPVHGELAALWERSGLPKHFEVKWTKVSPARLDFYCAVLEWFFSSEDITFCALSLPDKQRLYAALPVEPRDELYYRLYYQLLRCVIEPENRYRIFLDLKDTRGREKLAHLTEKLRTDADDPYGKSVENLQHVRSHEVKLLQVCDLLLGAINFARCRKADKESIAKRKLVGFIEEKLGYPLTADSSPGTDKFALTTWHDPDALLL